MNQSAEHTHIAIVGSGFSGIAMARYLKKSGRNDFVIFEKGNDVGGTWRDNTYPGIACDVPSNLYSFSFALNPDWSRSYSGGWEINNYIRATAKKLDILKHIRFNTAVLSAAWDDDAQLWRGETEAGPFTADFVIGAMGPLSEPAIPDLPGIEKFQGEAFHSQHWDHEYDLKGKRVAVVGTGASAIQFVPQIQPDVAELHLYQRTPPWILPRSERSLTKFEHKLYRYLPFTQKIARGFVYSMLEMRVIGFVKQPQIMRIAQLGAKLNIRRHIKDKELRKKVTPDFAFGCKRVLMANNYYPALAQDNVEVITHGVTEVRENSIVASDGTEREIDAIIWGTGFYVTDNPEWNNLMGRDGRSLTETWAPTGMRSYLGTLVPNFPNAFLIIGPNTGLGHSSMVYMIESNVEYILSVLDHVEKNSAAAVEVKEQTVANFEDDIVERSKGTVWTSGGCDSWYLDASGRNTTLWPDFTFRFRKLCREFEPGQVTLRAKGESAEPVEAPAEPAAV
ncbi:MAG: NAD(P)/FAD-dependent oxidoreductase [Thermoleophilaceae bacterium]|nr:NAD(P)/FAD-dependent oxidoreductase [Thermoleophilaceae bacterium]